MRHLRRSSAAVLAVLLIFCAYMGFRYWKEHTPEAALAHIGHAAAAEDRDGFDQYVDTDAVLAGLSEDAAALLRRRCRMTQAPFIIFYTVYLIRHRD